MMKPAGDKEGSFARGSGTGIEKRERNSTCEPSSSERVTGANTPSGGSGYGNSKGFAVDVST